MTIKSQPPATSSVNNEMLFVVSDAHAADPVTYPDYSYVLDVYVNSVLIERLIARPDPTYDLGVFDVSKALQPYCSYGFNAASNSVDYTVRIAYQVKIGEQYGGTLYTNILADSSDRYAIESYADKPLLNTSVLVNNGKASPMPSTVYHHREALWQLFPFFSNVTGSADLTYQQRDEAGSILQNDSLSMAGHAANTIRQFNVGESALNILSTAKYATIAWPDAATVIQTIRYLDECRYDVRTLVWLNPYGGYDSQTFGLVSKKAIEIERKSFSQLDYRIDVSGIVTYQADNVFYGGKRSFASKTKAKWSLTSHLLTANEFTWLAGLFKSTDVYMYDEAMVAFVPVTITKSNYEYLDRINAPIQPLQFDVELPFINNSQFL